MLCARMLMHCCYAHDIALHHQLRASAHTHFTHTTRTRYRTLHALCLTLRARTVARLLRTHVAPLCSCAIVLLRPRYATLLPVAARAAPRCCRLPDAGMVASVGTYARAPARCCRTRPRVRHAVVARCWRALLLDRRQYLIALFAWF
jgi:hypothetical protein